MIVYGMAVQLIYEKYKRTTDRMALALIVMLGYGLILSFTSFSFSSYNYAIGMLLVIFVLYKRNNDMRAGIERWDQNVRIDK